MYAEIFLIFLLLGAGGGLHVLFRASLRRFRLSMERPLGVFFSRLSFPLAFLLLAMVTKESGVRDTLFPSPRFHPYLDAAFAFFFVLFLIRLVDGLLLGWYARRRTPFPLPGVLHSLILAVLYAGVLFVILKGSLGINITPFLATSAILTMILGLAFQGVLNNILSGMSLHFTRSFSQNDWIRIGSDEGVVIDTNWRETRILDRFSNILILPNTIVASEKITNFSHPSPKSAVTLSVKASFNAAPTEVLEAVKEAAADVPEVLSSPAPEAYVLGFDDTGVSYEVKFWISQFARKYLVMTDVGRLIWYKFKRRGIEIPIPLSDKLKEVVGAVKTPEEMPGALEERERNFEDLMESSFLRYQEGEKKGALLVSEEEIRLLAGHIRRRRYAPGECLFRQGQRGDVCYLVASGSIKGEIVYEEKGGKVYKTEFRVKRGGIFGEMSLFTGMPRTATGIVEEESEILEVTPRDFSRLLERNPNLAREIAGLVSLRNRKNREFLRKIRELSEQEIKASTSKRSILNRLRSLIKRA